MAASDTVTDDSIAWMLGKAVELNLMRDGVIKLYWHNRYESQLVRNGPVGLAMT
jgi:hypothetical protein